MDVSTVLQCLVCVANVTGTLCPGSANSLCRPDPAWKP